ncbi:MAG TPA: hypothetical protein IGS52_06465 [Oscillatoriaceae cyanobacterium M33_DOE_052]|uniref:DUF5895 domain-containing protein n=1 Tax=Planktothricoides sp. SpSt-374 TaxID=2282167 RepID=A0A7C3VGU6_9CYAN|nr:hypothetical protein [Oscillatoriaceae cyanobacterium M33_DOE_052]
MTSKIKSSLTFDFEDEKFKAPPSQVLPWCHMINPQREAGKGANNFGLAIKQDNANAVGFVPDENWQLVEHQFSTGEVETIFITTSPRLVLVRRGAVYLKYRDTGLTLGRLGDHYDTFMADKLRFKTFTRHLIFFLGQDKKLLHSSPLRLSLSGAAGASFGKAYVDYKAGQATNGFTVELEKAYADYCGKRYAPKGPLFHAHGIFCPRLEAREAGMGLNTAVVAATVDYEHPTGVNFPEYAIASNSEESAIICQTFEEHQDFDNDIPKGGNGKIPGLDAAKMYAYPGEEFEYENEPLY